MSNGPAEEMLPGEILAARDRCGCAFVPVSPAFEWHSFHLPPGTDALVAEGVARAGAEAVGGIWFRPLSFGLDEWRPEEQLLAWGFEKDDRIFGMNFPDLPLASEYCEPEEMCAAVTNRLRALRACGFRHAFIVVSHGGTGQFPTLEALAERSGDESLAVHACRTGQFNTISHEQMRVGGHAGLSETLWLMAFRPELVDLDQQPKGPLTVRTSGILHRRPDIEARYNPRRVDPELARALHDSVVENIGKYVRQCLEAG